MIFTPVIVRHRKLIFFRFSIFFTKTCRQNGLNLLKDYMYFYIYILHYYDFFKRNDRLDWVFDFSKQKNHDS